MAVLFRRRGEAPHLYKLASDYAVGDSVFLPVLQVNTEFLVVHQGNPDSAIYSTTCDGTWLLMKDCYELRAWHSSNVNDYENSDIDAYLNGDFWKSRLASLHRAIKTVKIPYRAGSGTSKTVTNLENGLETNVFLLSGAELGFTSSDSTYFPTDEGAKLDYFSSGSGTAAKNKRIAQVIKGGAPANAAWWMRSPRCYSNSQRAFLVATDGTSSTATASTTSNAVRPAIIINSDTKFDPDTNIIKG